MTEHNRMKAQLNVDAAYRGAQGKGRTVAFAAAMGTAKVQLGTVKGAWDMAATAQDSVEGK